MPPVSLPAVLDPVLADPGRTCLVMGVVNVTPDSFSDGGHWFDPEIAVAHGLSLRAQGADLVDVGGESTRPGSARVDEAEELRRVLPVVRALAAEGVVVSVDTTRARVAEAAVEAGAVLVNDVSGGAADASMAPAVAALGVPYVVMHWRAHSDVMDTASVYADLLAEVRDETLRRVDEAVTAGVDPARIIVDPGLGFAKRAEHNWALLAALPEIVGWGLPVLVGASRKRFLAACTPEGAPPSARDAATASVSTLVAAAGAWAVRVHEVPSSRAAVEVAARIISHRRSTP